MGRLCVVQSNMQQLPWILIDCISYDMLQILIDLCLSMYLCLHLYVSKYMKIYINTHPPEPVELNLKILSLESDSNKLKKKKDDKMPGLVIPKLKNSLPF